MTHLKALLCLVLISAPALAAANLDDVLNGYRDVSTALAKDNFADAAAKAAKLVPVAEEMAALGDANVASYKKVLAGAKAMAGATKEPALRLQMSTLSEGAVWLVKATPALQAKWQLFKCPMVGGGAFQFWMQPLTDPMANPYMGQEMLQCGVKRAWAKFP
jgi:hypothetical protein